MTRTERGRASSIRHVSLSGTILAATAALFLGSVGCGGPDRGALAWDLADVIRYHAERVLTGSFETGSFRGEWRPLVDRLHETKGSDGRVLPKEGLAEYTVAARKFGEACAETQSVAASRAFEELSNALFQEELRRALGESSGRSVDPPARREAPQRAPVPPAPPSSRAKQEYPGTEAGAQALVSQFTTAGADLAALSKGLRPAAEDYEAIFESKVAQKARETFTKAWDEGKMNVSRPPLPSFNKLAIKSATSEDIKKWTDRAGECFPRQMMLLGRFLNDGVTFYSFSWVESAGDDSGLPGGQLVHVNGRWVLLSSPWRVLDALSST